MRRGATMRVMTQQRPKVIRQQVPKVEKQQSRPILRVERGCYGQRLTRSRRCWWIHPQLSPRQRSNTMRKRVRVEMRRYLMKSPTNMLPMQSPMKRAMQQNILRMSLGRAARVISLIMLILCWQLASPTAQKQSKNSSLIWAVGTMRPGVLLLYSVVLAVRLPEGWISYSKTGSKMSLFTEGSDLMRDSITNWLDQWRSGGRKVQRGALKVVVGMLIRSQLMLCRSRQSLDLCSRWPSWSLERSATRGNEVLPYSQLQFISWVQLGVSVMRMCKTVPSSKKGLGYSVDSCLTVLLLFPASLPLATVSLCVQGGFFAVKQEERHDYSLSGEGAAIMLAIWETARTRRPAQRRRRRQWGSLRRRRQMENKFCYNCIKYHTNYALPGQYALMYFLFEAMNDLTPLLIPTDPNQSHPLLHHGTISLSPHGLVLTASIFHPATLILSDKTNSYTISPSAVLKPQYSQQELVSLTISADRHSLTVESDEPTILLEILHALKFTHHHASFNPHFKVVQRVARQNFVAQYLVQSKHNHKTYSAKVYPKQGAQEQLQQVVSSVRLSARTSPHPNLALLQGTYSTDNLLYVVHQMVAGITLDAFARNKHNLKSDSFSNLITDLIAVLNHALSCKVAFKAIKMSNIILRDSDSKWVVVDAQLVEDSKSHEELTHMMIQNFHQISKRKVQSFEEIKSIMENQHSYIQPNVDISLKKPKATGSNFKTIVPKKRLSSGSKSKGLFKLADIKQMSTMSRSHGSLWNVKAKRSSLHFSDNRHSTFYMNISLPSRSLKTKTESSFYSSQRPSRNSSKGRPSKKNRQDFWGSRLKGESLKKCKVGKVQQSLMSPVSAADEQKLMKKLQKRAKMLADTVGQLEQLKHSRMAKEQQERQQKVKQMQNNKDVIKQESLKKIVDEIKANSPEEKYQEKKPVRLDTQTSNEVKKKQSHLSISNVLRQQIVIHKHNNPVKAPKLTDKESQLTEQKQALLDKTLTIEEIKGQIVNKQESKIPKSMHKSHGPKTKIAKSAPKPPNFLPNKQKQSEDYAADSQIQVVQIDINLNKNDKRSNINSKTTADKLDMKQKSACNPKKQVPSKQADLVGYFSQKFNTLDLMGLAVVNTGSYLKQFQKIFWQLPLFFIYRSFYLKREKMLRQLNKVMPTGKMYQQLKEENEKIQGAVTKMIRLVIKKIKKTDAKTLPMLEPFLNLDPSVNCEEPMKNLVFEYIDSIDQALEECPELTIHRIELTDSFLLHKGQHIEPNAWSRLKSRDEERKYLEDQKRKLKELL